MTSLDPDPLYAEDEPPVVVDATRTSLSEVAMILSAIALVAAIIVALAKA